MTIAVRCTAPPSAGEQDVSNVDSGNAFLGCHPLHQLGDLQGELDHKALQPVGATDRGNLANYR